MEKLRRFIARLMTMVLLLGTVVDGALPMQVQAAPKGNVSIYFKSKNVTKKSITMQVGETGKLKVKVSPKSEKKKVTFKSANKKVVTVSAKGKMKAVASGKTKVKVCVKTKSGKKKNTFVKIVVNNAQKNQQTNNNNYVPQVVHPTSVVLSNCPVTMEVGTSVLITARVAPGNAANKQVIWTSSDNNILTVNDRGNVNAISGGEATITATTVDGNVSASCTIKTIVSTTGITVTPANIELEPGASTQLEAKVVPDNATDQSIIWNSSDTAIATVTSNGEVKAVAVGEAVITAQNGTNGKSASSAIKVVIRPTDVKIDEQKHIEVGETVELIPIFAPDNTTERTLMWSSDDSTIVSVDENGKLTGMSIGEAIVTATTSDGKIQTTCNVEVSKATASVSEVQLSVSETTLKVNEEVQLKATVLPGNAYNKNITWKSSNKQVAVVSEDGLVTAKRSGSADIVVTTLDGNKTATCKVTVIKGEENYKAGEIWTGSGAWEISVTGARSHSKCNPYCNYSGNEVVLIDIVAKNISYTDKYWNYLYMSSNKFSVCDQYGDKGQSYPCSHDSYGTDLYVGESCTASYAYIIPRISSKVKVTVDIYNSAVGKSETATFDVNVDDKEPQIIDATGVRLDQSEISLKEGKSKQLTATVEPENATNKSVKWLSDDTDIVEVSTTGVVKAKAAGDATVYATTKDGGYIASCKVHVDPIVYVTDVVLDKKEVSLGIRDSAILKATVMPENAEDTSVVWKSSDEGIVTVDEKGKIVAKGIGTATITVTSTEGNKNATCVVTVDDRPVLFFKDGLEKTLYINKPETLQVETTATEELSWSSDNENIATVDENTGKITPISVGNCIISVRAGELSKKIIIYVNEVGVTVNSEYGTDIKEISVTFTNYSDHNIAYPERIPVVIGDNILYLNGNYQSKEQIIDAGKSVTYKFKNADGKAFAYDMDDRMYFEYTSGNKEYGMLQVDGEEQTIWRTNEIEHSSVTLNETRRIIKPKDIFQLKVESEAQNNIHINWKSVDCDVATVSENGEVLGIEDGTTYIYAMDDNGHFLSYCEVDVNTEDVVEIIETKMVNEVPQIYMYLDSTIQLKALTNMDSPITWSVDTSSTTSSVSVNKNTGVVTPSGIGAGIVVATCGSKKNAVLVNVLGVDVSCDTSNCSSMAQYLTMSVTNRTSKTIEFENSIMVGNSVLYIDGNTMSLDMISIAPGETVSITYKPMKYPYSSMTSSFVYNKDSVIGYYYYIDGTKYIGQGYANFANVTQIKSR